MVCEEAPGLALVSGKKAYSKSDNSRRRQLSEKRGRWAEWLAAGLLTCKGYRILSRRVKTPFGEIDLIARRGHRVAFVEVKYRKAFASDAPPISRRQSERIAKAAEYWLWRQANFRGHRMGLDCVLVSPAGLPRHMPDALQPTS